MCRAGWVACGGRLFSGVVVTEPQGVAVVLRHQGVRVGGGGGVLMPLVVPRYLALRGWRPLCLVDLCGLRSLTGPQSRGAVVPRWCWALGRVLLVVCPGALEVGWGDVARPGSRLGCRILLAGALAGLLACLGLLGLVGVGGRWYPLSSQGLRGVRLPAMRFSESFFPAPDVGALVRRVHLCGGGFAGGV